MKLFFITSRFPFPIEKGDKLRVYYQLIELSRYYDIYLFSLSDYAPEPDHIKAIQPYCKEIINVTHNRMSSIKSIMAGMLSKVPIQTRYFYSSILERKLIKAVDHIKPDHIHFHLIRTTEYLKSHQKTSSVDLMDSFSLGISGLENKFTWLKKQFYKLEGRLVTGYEQTVAKRFGKSFIISERDRHHIDEQRLFGIEILKNGIDTVQFSKKIIRKTHDIVFVGNLGYMPNIEAVKVINLLAKRNPDWTFLIAGARSESLSSIQLESNITMLGWVDDIRDAYCAGKIFLAPIHHGSGLQNKILEALSLQLPCITTSFVNDAIQASPGKEIIVADTLDEMEQSVKDLFNNQEQMTDCALSGYKFVTNNFSWKEKTRPLIEYIKNK